MAPMFFVSPILFHIFTPSAVTLGKHYALHVVFVWLEWSWICWILLGWILVIHQPPRYNSKTAVICPTSSKLRATFEEFYPWRCGIHLLDMMLLSLWLERRKVKKHFVWQMDAVWPGVRLDQRLIKYDTVRCSIYDMDQYKSTCTGRQKPISQAVLTDQLYPKHLVINSYLAWSVRILPSKFSTWKLIVPDRQLETRPLLLPQCPDNNHGKYIVPFQFLPSPTSMNARKHTNFRSIPLPYLPVPCLYHLVSVLNVKSKILKPPHPQILMEILF